MDHGRTFRSQSTRIGCSQAVNAAPHEGCVLSKTTRDRKLNSRFLFPSALSRFPPPAVGDDVVDTITLVDPNGVKYELETRSGPGVQHGCALEDGERLADDRHAANMNIPSDVVNERILALERQLVVVVQTEVAPLWDHIKQCTRRMDSMDATISAQDSKVAAFVARTPTTVAAAVREADVVLSDCFSSASNAGVENEIADLVLVGGKCPGLEDCQSQVGPGSGHETPKPAPMTTCQDEVHGGPPLVCTDHREVAMQPSCADESQGVSSCVQDSAEDDTIEVRLGESVWDATVMIGHPYVGTAGSIVLVALLILNCAMQLLFLYIIRQGLTSITFPEDEVQAFHYFRSSIAHSIDVLDFQTELTLAARVCDNDPSLHWGIRQADAVGMVDDYITGYAGPAVCLTASLVWIFTVLGYLRQSCLLMWAVVRMSSHNAVENRTRIHSVFRALSGRQRLMIGMVMSVRLAIVVVLLWYGLKYLSYTVSIPDLLYNAAALELVLTVDELIYAALSPVHVRNALTEVEPVQIHASAVGGIDVEAIVSYFVAIGALLSSAFLWFQPQMEQLMLALEELCNGNKDFVMGYTPDGWLSWTDANVADVDQVQSTNKFHVIRQLIETERSEYEATEVFGLNGTLLQFRALAAKSRTSSIDEQMTWKMDRILGAYNAGCRDIGDPSSLHSSRLLGSIRDTLGSQSISHCGEVLEHCGRNTLAGVRVRSACPKMCGCHTPASNLVPAGVDAGCSPGCRRLASYDAGLSLALCVDTPVANLRVVVQSYRIYFMDFTGQIFKELLDGIMWAIDEMDKVGCGGVQNIVSRLGPGWNFCNADQWPTFGVRNLNFHCPLTCNCEAGIRDCPKSCASTFSNETSLH